MSRNELIYDIREALSVSLYGTAATISNMTTRRLVGSLEMLEEDQLSALLVVSRKAASMVDDSVSPGHAFHDDPAMCRDHCRGEGVLRLRHWISRNELKSVYVLAKAVDLIPDGMRFLRAINTIDSVLIERFPLDTREQVAAHLQAAHGLATLRTAYRPDMMLLVHTHPDKVRTILSIAEKHDNTPTHREVLDHHGVEPALFDGVL